MVIDIGGLFKDTRVNALQSSSQVSRWQQDGSVIKNIVSSWNGGGVLAYTVTAGKTLYITSLSYFVEIAFTGTPQLEDGVADGGSARFRFDSANFRMPAGTLMTMTFNTPLIFNTGIYMDSTAGNGTLNLQGWEE